ncbi:BNR repeat-containing protein [Gilvimarinus sp. SDUM040013]|uniref:BNR repeat-containing protein n=1 Tax=Gilvimarinus gilvus TaxID=3058038 RepID=A0ABU4S164_9GAMM|nr:BNR repeat-containing protein [Gilvimarinus sp. SDUM040013]MDO3387275.1 BNR repeat-containing protein [Gilvimarinus sp. SDUM040013]MDX6848964.1 BNR repeat-containing protein [Gilvimarinus sp. SDUM040013]
MRKSCTLLALLFFGALVGVPFGALAAGQSAETQTKGIDKIHLFKSAYAASSVNVVAGSRQTLFTDNGYQYAGFYSAQGEVHLAKRRLPGKQWEIQSTGFHTTPEDAHNTISLVVDGQGYLHLAWGHDNTPLNYSRSLKPGSLIMGEPQSMLGEGEKSVTYPQFFRRANGNLLFLYRDGGSGNGRLLLNHYDTKSAQWSRRQNNLIDGQNERSAYWDMTIDKEGLLHLAWTWRETPDVASNHDLLYARSGDGGHTWQRADGTRYKLPITQGRAEAAAIVAQRSNLMNPPFIAVGKDGQPMIVSYWSPAPGARPRFNLVYRDDTVWRTVAGPEAGQDFSLAGHGTKRPPISRAALLSETSDNSSRVHLIYRDDSEGGRVVAATLDSLQDNTWQLRFLTTQGVGGWEPSLDPTQWKQSQQAHLLLQTVGQVDGDDAGGSGIGPTPLDVLIWHP